jgi:Ca2+-binding EF-hand superfamily protein
MNNLGDFQLALKFHTLANHQITPTEFQRAVKISSGFELDPMIVEVIFKVFDEDSDGKLSYLEFIAVLKDRLKRGLNVNI